MKRYLGVKKVLRIYINNNDRIKGKPLWQFILKEAKDFGLKGATVFKGVAGVGAHSLIHTFDIWSLSQELPIVIEMIDEEKLLREFIEKISSNIKEGLITLHDAEVILYNHPKNGEA